MAESEAEMHRLIKKRKTNASGNAEDVDTGASGSMTVLTETNFVGSGSSSTEINNSASTGNCHEVFLSFRGPDTRHGFTDHLYHGLLNAGIDAFRDDEELRQGENIKPELLAAIRNSKISIPIFSVNYGRSRWCLDELVQIMECKNNDGQIVLPIFYKVKPDEVRYQTGRFGEASKEREKRSLGKSSFDPAILEKWKQALIEVSNLKGYEANGSEAKLVKSVVQKVLNELKKKFELIISENLVGIDSHVKNVMELLDDKSHALLFFGIHGMGGIGKTTLAKTIYNKLSNQFEHRSFIADITESWKRGAHDLQNQLIFDISNQKNEVCNKDEGINFISSRFKDKKVLLLLDDVDNVDQVKCLAGNHDWFSLGSRIIITARNKRILELAGVDHNYGLTELDYDQSLVLFSKHAFRKDFPPSKFEDVTHEVVFTTGGLPLSLEVLGSLLCGKELEEWRKMIKKLGKIPHIEVQEKLRISYDALEYEQKKIFLDIACFLISTDRRIAFYMWDACEFFSEENIEVLRYKSLIKIGDDLKLQMHDQLRDLGRVIVREENYRQPWHHSRLWDFEEALKVLKRNKLANMEEKRQVASIGKYVGTDDQVNHIMNLMNVDARDKRMVVVIHGEAGIGKTTLAKLIYSQVSWDFDGCSFLADITETTRELGGLQLLQSKLISDVLKRELEDVTFISRGIDFFRDTFCNMRVLIVLDDVENPFHVEKLIGDGFDCFASGSRILVTTRNSAVLEESPQTRAYHVSRLNKDQARRLIWQHAPEPISRKILYSAHDTMAGLPLFIEVMGAVLNSTPEERWSQSPIKPVFRQQNFRPILGEVYQILDDKQKQIFLDIACFITGIDSRIAWYLWYDFSFLHYSKFGDEFLTPLAKIGENNQIWMHSMLRQFGREIVSGENLTDPGGESRIFNPEIALDTIKRKKGKEKVEALCLNFQWHTSEKLTAEDFESMPNLRFLQLDHADIAGDFANVFPNLRWLRWRGCPRHLQVTNFHLGNLTILDLSWSKVTKDWEGWDQIEMKNLRVLDLTGCADLLVTPKFSSCQNLALLILERCSQLVEIDHSIGDLKCLASLNLNFCTELSMLPVEVGQLTALKELLMDETSVQEIPVSIGYLKQLQTLSASNCFSLSQLSKTICRLTNIKLLSLDGTGITALPDSIGELVRLEHLSLRDCYQIRKLPNSIGNMGGSLTELDVSGTGIVKFWHLLKKLWTLKVLRMDSCFFREFPPDIGELTNLEEIHACWCLSLEGGIPSEIGKLHNLRILRLRHSTISSIPAEIHQLSNLRTLDLLHCDMIKELPELPSSITVLYVDDELKSSHLP